MPETVDPSTVSTNGLASTIAHLYGDRFAPTLGPNERGQRTFAGGPRVDTLAFAKTLMSIALWDLRRRGAISLEPYQEKKLFGTKSGVRIRLLTEVAVSGIDAKLMGVLLKQRKARESGIELKDVVHHSVPTSVYPAMEAVGLAIEAEIEQGYIVWGTVAGAPDKHGKPGKPQKTVEPVEDRVAILAPLAAMLVTEWADFGTAEPELKEQLLKGSESGISLSTRSEVDDNDD